MRWGTCGLWFMWGGGLLYVEVGWSGGKARVHKAWSMERVRELGLAEGLSYICRGGLGQLGAICGG